jgi:DNA-binding transcriptional LysR family regulator
MEHLRRLYRVWNWLPAFRVVAETEHLPSASELLHVTPSALSRSIKQLEDELGQQLFRRVGRRLELSPAGEELLRALRESMRRLDRGLAAASTSQFVGPLRVSAPEPFASALALDAFDRLTQLHPLLVPNLTALAPETACRWVVDRRLDVAVLEQPSPEPGLHIERLGALRYAVYCAEGHPLFAEDRPALDDVLRHGFVSPPQSVPAPWPPHLERDVAMGVGDTQQALRVCGRGRHLALLPDLVVRGHRGERPLRRLPLELALEQEVFAVHRASAAEGPVLALLDELREGFVRPVSE